MPRHRSVDFLKFLKKIDRETLPHLDLDLIVDNYFTHKTPAVQRWLKRHPRFKLHFIPTSSSWLNLVERLFAEITRQQIRRGVFHSIPELEAAIVKWINQRNANPQPFVWTATARSITLKRNRAKKALANLATGCKSMSRSTSAICRPAFSAQPPFCARPLTLRAARRCRRRSQVSPVCGSSACRAGGETPKS